MRRAIEVSSVALWIMMLIAGCSSSGSAEQDGASKGPSAKREPEAASLDLSPEGEQAFAYLAAARRFTDDAIYYEGATPKEVMALRILWREEDPASVLSALYSRPTTAGKLYALCGLYYADPPEFERLIQELRDTGERIEFQSGCSLLRDYPAAKLIRNDAPGTVRLDSRDQTIKEWRASKGEAQACHYDIAGGAYPNLFRDGGGYYDVGIPSLDGGVE